MVHASSGLVISLTSRNTLKKSFKIIEHVLGWTLWSVLHVSVYVKYVTTLHYAYTGEHELLKTRMYLLFCTLFCSTGIIIFKVVGTEIITFYFRLSTNFGVTIKLQRQMLWTKISSHITIESQKPEPIHEFISLSVLFLRHPVPRERPPYMVLKTTWQAWWNEDGQKKPKKYTHRLTRKSFYSGVFA